MALTDESNGSMVMPVAPMYGNNGGNGWGGDSSWWFILLILAMFGGWGNGFGGGFDGAGLYPWMNNANQISNGFDNAALCHQWFWRCPDRSVRWFRRSERRYCQRFCTG